MSKAISSDLVKKAFYFLLPFILTLILVMSIIAVARAAETGASPAKEGMNTEEMVSSPGSGSAMQAPAEAVQEAMSDADRSGDPAAQEAPPEAAKSEGAGGGR